MPEYIFLELANSPPCQVALSSVIYELIMSAFTIWLGMKSRCSNPNQLNFANYGARGIRVCERWLLFDNFLKDMGEPPLNHTLDRIDVDGDYTPDNCRWSHIYQQATNRSIPFRGYSKYRKGFRLRLRLAPSLPIYQPCCLTEAQAQLLVADTLFEREMHLRLGFI